MKKLFIRRWGLFSLGIALLLPISAVYAQQSSLSNRSVNTTIRSTSTQAVVSPESTLAMKNAVVSIKEPASAKPAPKAISKKNTHASTHKAKAKKHKRTVKQSELELLARAVYSEARGETFRGQVAVAAVILNRTTSSEFPHSVRGVIFQKNAFTAVSDGQFWLKPNATAYHAAKQALKGADPTNGAVYYYNPTTASSSWMKEKAAKSATTRIGNHVFMK